MPEQRSTRELELNKQDSFTVPAKDPRYATGILLRKGSVYKFEVIPKEQTWKDGEKLKPFTADGRTMPLLLLPHLFLRMPLVKWFALLGSIDNKRCTYFKIGTYLEEYSPAQDGELVCFANDAWGFNDHWYTHNNSGQITVYITKIRD